MTNKQILNGGQSLFEVVLALGVITAITVGIVSLTANAIRNSAFSKNKTLAGRYAQEATEWLRSQRDNSFNTFNGRLSKSMNYCLPGPLNWDKFTVCGASDNIPNTPLFRQVTFSKNSDPTKIIIQADVKVYWTDGQGYHEVRSATSFSDWRQR